MVGKSVIRTFQMLCSAVHFEGLNGGLFVRSSVVNSIISHLPFESTVRSASIGLSSSKRRVFAISSIVSRSADGPVNFSIFIISFSSFLLFLLLRRHRVVFVVVEKTTIGITSFFNN